MQMVCLCFVQSPKDLVRFVHNLRDTVDFAQNLRDMVRFAQNLRDMVRFAHNLRDTVDFAQNLKDLVRFAMKLISTDSRIQSISFFRAEVRCLVKAGSRKLKSLKETGSLNLEIINRWQIRWDTLNLTITCNPSSSGPSLNLRCTE